jgi:AraC-like DNA-binding protein
MLQGYIEKLWVFESSGPVPNDDLKLIVPNGLIKLVIPYRNGLSGRMKGWELLSKEHQTTLIGICDQPSIVEAETDGPSGTIGVEFSPIGAYRFFRLRHNDIRNQIHLLSDVLGKAAAQLTEEVANTESVAAKVKILQEFLLRQFLKTAPDSVFDHCVRKIMRSNGSVTVQQLEKETGYSSRWLHMRFMEHLGISPKNLSAITRFQYCYQALVTKPEAFLQQRELYSYYYDQSHFIKEFRRFTDYSPTKIIAATNEFGKLFYQ